MADQMPIIAVTRAVPGRVKVEGATTRVLESEPPSRAQVLEHVRGSSVVVSMFSDSVDDELLDAAGDQLCGVCNFAVGFNNIDLETCKKRGVTVCNTPDAVTEGTANLAMTLILASARRLIEADRYARSDAYPNNGVLPMDGFLGMDLCGKTLLIVGAGRIGYATALRARAFGMQVAYVARSRHIDFEMAPLGAARVSLEKGLGLADVVSVHAPLTDQTRHLLNRDNLKFLKPEAIVVNTARGPVIDEDALAEALDSGRLYAVGLDVFEREPEVHPLLKAHPRAVLTPHIGSAEIRWREAMSEMVSVNAAAMLAGGTPPNQVR